MNTKISIITGTYPPEKCGVGDYTFNLIQTVGAKNWKLLYYTDWTLKTLFEKIYQIKNSEGDVINIQYPCMGYGYSIVPHLLCLYFSLFSKKQFSITIHEFIRMGRKSKIASMIFLIFAQKIIFTNEFEREAAIKKLFFVKNKSTVLKIYSNIKQSSTFHEIPVRKYDIGYFGLISPLKGIEDFLLVIKQLLVENSNYQVYIMGQTQPEYESYYSSIINNAKEIGITLFLNEDQNFVTGILSDTKLCYLPYPDGVSERRGSFLAAVLNYCIILTTKGIFTTKAHQSFCSFSDKTHAAKTIVDILNQKNTEYYKNCQNQMKLFIDKEIPKSWEQVAEQYNSLF